MSVRTINGIRLHYHELGDRAKPTLVFAHPVLFDATVFDSLVANLENDFRIILLDVHGHGESGYRESLTLEDMTADFYQLLRALRLTKVTWLGYSIGGMIGMRLALDHPEMIESLILVAATASLDSPPLREQTWWLWQMFRAGHREDIVDAALRFFFAPATFESQPELTTKYRNRVLGYSQSQAERMFEVARAVLQRTDISKEIVSINMPTLVIGGKDDLAPAPAELEFISSRISQGRLEIVDEASHLLVIEKPQTVTKIVREFLGAPKQPEESLNGDGAKGRRSPQLASSISSTIAPGESASLNVTRRERDLLLRPRRKRRFKRIALKRAARRRNRIDERLAA